MYFCRVLRVSLWSNWEEYSCGNDNEGIYFEVCELEVYVDGVEADNEVEKDILRFFGNMGEECCLDC